MTLPREYPATTLAIDRSPSEEKRYIVCDPMPPLPTMRCVVGNVLDARQWQAAGKDVRAYTLGVAFNDLQVADFVNPAPESDTSRAFENQVEGIEQAEDTFADAADEEQQHGDQQTGYVV